MKDMQLKVKLPPEAIKYTFKNAIQEVEALREFYIMYHNTWIKSKIEFEQQYATALQISDSIEKLLDSEDPENDYLRIQESNIGETKFKEIIELRIRRENKSTRVSYLMNKRFSDQDPQKAHDQKYKYDQQREIFIRSILSNIVIIFERYLAQIFEFLVVLNPEKYFEGKTVKISELIYSSPKQIISNEVRKCVSENMYDSLNTLDMMKVKSGFNIDRYTPIQDDFEEIYYRRNIFVHNSGIANEIYLNNIAEKYKTKVQKDAKLLCDDVYIENAIGTLKKVICVLLYEFLLATDRETESYDILADIAFSSLSNKEYLFCEFIYNILRRHKQFDFADKTLYQVNYMIALKQQGKPISKELEKFDTSAMQERFVIAKYCLQDDNKAVYALLKEIYPEQLPMEAIRDWPLFINFRNSEEYRKFVAEHKQDFNIYTFESPEISDVLNTDELTDVVCDEVQIDK